MYLTIIKTAAMCLALGVSSLAFGQTDAAMKPSVVSGDVASVSDSKIVLNTNKGPVDVSLSDKTVYKRVSAENPSLQAATSAALSDISVGDKLTVTGILAADGKSIPARSIFLMTKAEISQKNVKQSEQWKTRGIAGRVVSVNPRTGQIEVEMRSMMGSTKLALTPKSNTKFLRYAENSIRYDEAKASSVSDIKAGDMLRALGDRSPDGAGFAAEEIITGAFQTIAGTVKSVDVDKKEVVIKNLQGGKDVVIDVNDTSVFKKFPAEAAERMAGFQMGGGVRPPSQGSVTPPSGGQGQTPGTGRGGLGPRGGGIDEMLERFPNITAADLRAGDMIAISSTKSANVDRVKAIKFLAGVEPFLRMAQAPTGNNPRGQSVQGGFTIPGLDGAGF